MPFCIACGALANSPEYGSNASSPLGNKRPAARRNRLLDVDADVRLAHAVGGKAKSGCPARRTRPTGTRKVTGPGREVLVKRRAMGLISATQVHRAVQPASRTRSADSRSEKSPASCCTPRASLAADQCLVTINSFGSQSDASRN